MEYRAVGNRIAVDFNGRGISKDEALEILKKKNVRPIEVNIIELAKELVGRAQWKWGACQSEAPHFFDCSSLTKWLYGQKGIWIPRRAHQQFDFFPYGQMLFSVSVTERWDSAMKKQVIEEIVEGDLIFVSSPYKRGVKTDLDERIGHVCIASGAEQAICATNSEFGTGVVELPISTLFKSRKLSGIGRVIPDEADVTTFTFPSEREIETTDDIHVIVLQSLSK